MAIYTISAKKAGVFLKKLERSLFKKSKKKKVTLSIRWIDSMPLEPGIYVIFEKKTLVYVGETGNIQGRMWDMMDSRHHQLRRNVGRMNFSKIKGYREADSSTKFPAKIERKLDRWIQNKFKISALPLYLGRKELEEYIVEYYKPKYNKKGRRKQ